MQISHDGKRSSGGQAVRPNRTMRKAAEAGQQQLSNRDFAGPAQTQAGQGDAKLHRTKQLVEAAMQPLDGARAGASRSNELLQASLADADESKFGGHKEGIGRNQHQDGYDPEQGQTDHSRKL